MSNLEYDRERNKGKKEKEVIKLTEKVKNTTQQDDKFDYFGQIIQRCLK